jgi:hypothetical protein
MHINLTYIGAATFLFAIAFLSDYNLREQEKIAQQDCVKELLVDLLGHFPYNQRKLLSLRRYLTVDMMPKYERMRLHGYQVIDIQREIRRDANRFVDKNLN